MNVPLSKVEYNMLVQHLYILFVDVLPDDVHVLVRELEQSSYEVTHQCVETQAELKAALANQGWDVVLSDYIAPDTLNALKTLKAYDDDLPFIVVTGNTDKEAAVSAMKAGAADFFYKDDLVLLGAAVERELRDAQHRRQRKIAERQLRQSEKRFSAVVHASPVGTLLAQVSDGYIIDANEQFFKMTGYAPEQIVGYGVGEISLWVSDDQRQHIWQQVTDGAALESLEIDFYYASGERGIALLSTTNVDVDGEACVLSMIYDVTERNRALQTLKFQTTLLDTVGQAVVAADTTGRIIYWNRTAELMYGWSFAEVNGRDLVRTLVPEPDRTRAGEIVAELLQGGTWIGEFALTRRDGTIIPTLAHGAPIVDETGSITGIISISSDISQLKAYEVALQESERFSRATVDALAANIAILDETGEIIAVNQPWRNFASENGSTDKNAYLRANYLEVCDKAQGSPDASKVAAGIRAVMRGEQAFFTLDYPCHLPKQRRWFSVNVTRFGGAGPLRVVVAHENITERKEAEERLRLLHEISNSLISFSVEDQQRLYHFLYEQVAKRLYDAPHLVIAQYNPEARMITCEFAIVDHEIMDPALFPPREIGIGPVGDAIQQRRIIIRNPLDDARNPEKGKHAVRIGDERIPQSGIHIPLITGDKLYGIMSMQHYEPDVFSEKDVLLLSTIASQAATALENAHLYRRVHNHAQDLEARVRARTVELEQAKEWVESILASTSDVIVLADQHGNLIQANPAFREQFQYEPETLVMQPLDRIVARASAADFMEAIQQAIETKTTVNLDVVCVRQDTTLFEAELAVAPLSFQGQHGPNVVCAIYDVTRYRQIEDSLRNALEREKELNELKSRFSSMVSHEFRTPLSVILSAAGMLKIYGDRLSERNKMVKFDEIEAQVNRLVTMLDNILMLSRAESIEITATKKPVYLEDICREIVTEIQLTTAAHTISLAISGERRLAEVDPGLMGDILRNLLSNAIKYSPDGGTIHLQCQYKTHSLILRVTDEGLGIPPEDQERLFDAFHRANNVKDISGTGLGLTIVNNAVQAHQGAITVDSTLNVGTTFTITLPA